MALVKGSLPMDFKLSKVIRVILFALLAGSGIGIGVADEKKPNVLFISVDDLNDWTGALKGHPQAKTPHLDRLAESGVLFENAHCAAPACNPSRAALMTGIRPSTSGVYTNSQPWRQSPVLKDAPTIPQWFRQSGYEVFGAGKILHGAYQDPPSWDYYWPSQKQSKPGDPRPAQLPANGIPKTSHFDWGSHPEGKEEMGDWKVAEWVSGELHKKRENPFFLACGFYRPHLPWFAPQEYFDRFPLDEIVLPETLESDLDDIPEAGIKIAKPDGDHAKVIKHDQWKQAVQGYLASIAFADDCVGKVLDALDSSGHAEDTIVVLWSDHGWHLGEKKHWRKFALWEEATRVQMMWRVPGLTQPNSRTDNPANLLDIYPTLTDLCGLPANKAAEGISLKSVLQNPDKPINHPIVTTHGRKNHSVRNRKWRFTQYADGTRELYDHEVDPFEHTNLAGKEEHADLMTRLAKVMPKKNAKDSVSEKKKKK